jgi:hypothetical protein
MMSDTKQAQKQRVSSISELINGPYMDAFDSTFDGVELVGLDEVTEAYQGLIQRTIGLKNVPEDVILRLAQRLAYAADSFYEAGKDEGIESQKLYAAEHAAGTPTDLNVVEDGFCDDAANMGPNLPSLDVVLVAHPYMPLFVEPQLMPPFHDSAG